MTAADDQPLLLGAPQVADHDHTDCPLGGKHDGVPPFAPCLDGVVELLDLVEVLFLGAFSKERFDELAVRALLGKGLGSRDRSAMSAPSPPTANGLALAAPGTTRKRDPGGHVQSLDPLTDARQC
ncbi:hypothetical protein [Streptomyces sp. NPDC001927]